MKQNSLFVLILVCLFLSPVNMFISNVGADWVIDGDTVYIDDENVYLSATPHTLNDDGWVVFELETKSFDGDIDIVWGFDIPDCSPHNPQIWRNYTHEFVGYHYVDRVGSIDIYNVTGWVDLGIENYDNYIVDYGNNNNTYLMNISYEINGSLIVAFDVYVEFGNGDDYRLTGHYDSYESYFYYEDFFDWDSFDVVFDVIYYNHGGMNTWFLLEDVSVVHDYRYKVRAWVDIPFNTVGKYWWCLKPSDKTISEAVAEGSFYSLDPWWDSDWDYYKTITVADKIDDYQMKMLIDYNTDKGGNVSCEEHCQADFDDIRFVYNNATELPYWLENYTASSQATFWINNSGNYSSFEMYYGNDAVSTTSNASNTFISFDDEDWETDWTSNYITRSSSQARRGTYSCYHDGDKHASAYDWFDIVRMDNSHEWAFDYSIYLTDTSSTGKYVALTESNSQDATAQTVMISPVDSIVRYRTDPDWITFIDPYVTGVWYDLSFRDIDFDSDTYDIWVNDSLIVDDAGFRDPQTFSDYWQIGSSTTSVYIYFYVDVVRLRLWADPEPSWCGFGSEQTKPPGINPPTISSEYPTNESVDITLFPVLGVAIADVDVDGMNITWYSNVSGSWEVIGTNLSDVYNGTYYQKFDDFGIYGLTYYWNVSVTDGANIVDSGVFSFTAESTPSTTSFAIPAGIFLLGFLTAIVIKRRRSSNG